MNEQSAFSKQVKGGLIVSCQALEDEPLHSSFIMSKMALAAAQGGAVGIRANSAEDIAEIKKEVNLPIIGIVKRDYEGSDVFITATMKEIDELMAVEREVIESLKTAKKNNARTILITSNDQANFQNFCDEVFLVAIKKNLDEGRFISPQFPVLVMLDLLFAHFLNYSEHNTGLYTKTISEFKKSQIDYID